MAITHIHSAITNIQDALQDVKLTGIYVPAALTHILSAITHISAAITHIPDTLQDVKLTGTHIPVTITHITDTIHQVRLNRIHIPVTETHITDTITHIRDNFTTCRVDITCRYDAFMSCKVINSINDPAASGRGMVGIFSFFAASGGEYDPQRFNKWVLYKEIENY